jgi:hypothetical protein
MDLISNRPNLHRTVCGCLVQAMCQWTGVNVNNYYGPTIYTALGFGGTTTLMINGISGAWGVICVFTFITFIGELIMFRPDTCLTLSRSNRKKETPHSWSCRIGSVVSRAI